MIDQNFIRNKAFETGFDACGFTSVKFLAKEHNYFVEWLRGKDLGRLEYLRKNIAQKTDPSKINPAFRSVIALLQSHNTEEKQHPDSFYKVTKYAFGRDYHAVLKEKMALLADIIQEASPGSEVHCFVDSNRLLEKAWAIECGLGWRGKNSLLVNPDLGTFVFIGVIATTIEIEPDPVLPDRCGNCRKCIDACPAGALAIPYRLDAMKCIANLNIEQNIPDSINANTHGWIYGCDICQEACPWNNSKKIKRSAVFQPNADLLAMRRSDWENLDEERFEQLFADSAIKRIGFEKLKSNIRNVANQ